MSRCDGGGYMEIAIIADDNKKELMAQFCIAYCGILSHHHICATHVTGKYISDVTGLKIETYLSGHTGGTERGFLAEHGLSRGIGDKDGYSALILDGNGGIFGIARE